MNNTTPKISDIGTQFNKTLSSNAVTKTIRQIEAALSELKQIDTLLTDIRRLDSSLSKADLERINNNAVSNAGKYGKSITDYLTSIKNAVKAGYENAEGIAEISSAVQIAGDITVELADKYIYATDKAYNLGGSVEKLREILDGTNAIADNNALNMTDLAEGMSLAAKAAADLGISAGETSAAIAAIMAATGQNGTKTADTFLSMISGIQTALPDINGDQTASEALHSLLENYPLYETMLQQYSAGSGSMAVEVAKIADSWEVSLNRLSNTWTDTIGNIADSGAITTAINALNSLLNAVNTITDALGPAGTIAVVSGGILSAKDVGRLKNEA